MSFCPKCNSVRPEKADSQCPLCGTPLEERRILSPGTIVNGFTIQQEIGRGGMGTVYLAKQANLGRDIALKVMEDSMTMEKGFVDGFFREVRAVARLNHPNIVQAIDAGIANNDVYYFAMELLDGQNLDQYLNTEGALPLKLGLEVAEKIAMALAYATSKGLCHGDIKPENIVLKTNGEIKLADLGLARDFHSDRLNPGEIRATPAYAPPEVIRSQIEKIGFKSDMYSFGATLYHLLSGCTPFPGKSPEEICRKQLNDTAIPLHILNAQIPLYISNLVNYLMEKDPQERPDSWQTVLDILHQKILPPGIEPMEQEPAAEAETPVPVIQSFVLKYAVLILAFLIIVLVLLVILLTLPGKEEEHAPAKPPQAPKMNNEEKNHLVKPAPPVHVEKRPEETAAPATVSVPAVPDPVAESAPQPEHDETTDEWTQLKKQLEDKPEEVCLSILGRYIRKNGPQAATEAKIMFSDLTAKRAQRIQEQRLQQEKAAEARRQQNEKIYRQKLESFYKNLAKAEENAMNRVGLDSNDINVVEGISAEIRNFLSELKTVRKMAERLNFSPVTLTEEQKMAIAGYHSELNGHLGELKAKQRAESAAAQDQDQKKSAELPQLDAKAQRDHDLEEADKAELSNMSERQLRARSQKLQAFSRDLRKKGMFLWAERCDKQSREIQKFLQAD